MKSTYQFKCSNNNTLSLTGGNKIETIEIKRDVDQEIIKIKYSDLQKAINEFYINLNK